MQITTYIIYIYKKYKCNKVAVSNYICLTLFINFIMNQKIGE